METTINIGLIKDGNIKLFINRGISFTNEMNRRKIGASMTQIQQGISKFVAKSKGLNASAPVTTGKTNSSHSSTSTLKRTHQGSQSPSADKPPNKRQVTAPNKKPKTMDDSSQQQAVELNPELRELKR